MPNGFNALATLFRWFPLHLEHELTEGEVRDFASPRPPFQVSVKVQIFKETDVKLADKFQDEFPVMIFALTGNLSVCPTLCFCNRPLLTRLYPSH